MGRLDRLGAALARSFDRDGRTWMTLFILVYLAITAGMAARPFWYDELLTWHVTRLPDLATMWASLKDSLDLNPPGFYIATRTAQAFFGTGEVATRMPAIIGFLVMCLSLYRFVRRRCSQPYAIAAMLLPLITGGYRYAAEARGYGLEFGFIGLALTAWQDAADGRSRRLSLPLLTLALAGALMSHCYAPFAILAIAAGEAWRNWRARRIDWQIWLCFVISSPLVLVYLPLMASMKPFVSNNPIFAPQPMSVPLFYGALLSKAIWPLAALFLLARRTPPAVEKVACAIPGHEVACAAVFGVVPVMSFLFGVLKTGVFMERYGMAAMIGLAIGVAFYLARAWSNSREAGALAVAVIGCWMLLNAGASATTLLAASGEQGPPLAQADPELPIVVSNGLMFLEADMYEKPVNAFRLYYLTDPEAGVRYTGTNVFDVGYGKIARWVQLRGKVAPYRQFLKEHRKFTVYGTADHPMDWLIRRLRDEGVRLTFKRQHPGSYGTVMLLEASQD